MKVWSALVLLCIVFGSSQAGVTREEAEAAFRAMSEQCVMDTKASAADLDAIVNHEENITPEGKCLKACIMKKFEMMTDDGKLFKPGMQKMTELFLKGDADKMKIAERIIDECVEIAVGADHCENSHTYCLCLKKGAEANNLSMEW